MGRIGLLTAVMLSASAFAQDVDIQMGGMGMPNARIRTRGPGVQQELEAYQLNYARSPDGLTRMKVLQPEGARCEVTSDVGKSMRFEVPFSIEPTAERFYRYRCVLPDGSVFDKKLEAKTRQTGHLVMAGMVGPDVQIQVSPPPDFQPEPQPVVRERVVVRERPVVVHERVVIAEPQVPAGPIAMAQGDFDALCEAIESESFSEQKIGVLRTAAPSAWFTVSQVGKLVDLMDFSSGKVEVVSLTKAHIVDRQNAYQLQSHFTFSADKKKVQDLLR